MRRWIYFPLLLVMICGLISCGDIEPLVESSRVSVSTSTPTKQPEETPLPLMISSPSPTFTITPTSTPQTGDVRINPETEREQIFSEFGDWVEIVENVEGLKVVRVRDLQATDESDIFTQEEMVRVAGDLLILAELGAIAQDVELNVEKNSDGRVIYFTDAKGRTDISDTYGEGSFTIIAQDSRIPDGFFTLSIADFKKSLSDYGRLAFVESITVNSDGNFVAVDVSGNVISRQVFFDLSDGSSVAVLLPADADVEGFRFQLGGMGFVGKTFYLDKDDGLVYQVGDERHNPVSEKLEMLREDGTWAELSAIGMPPIMEPMSMDRVLQELEDIKYDNAWPLYKEPNNYDYGYTGKYVIKGLLTNHKFEEIHVGGEGAYVINVMSDLFYRDAAGQVQKIKIPVFIQNTETEYSFRPIRVGEAWPRLHSKDRLIWFVQQMYSMDSTSKMAFVEVKFLREKYTGDKSRVFELRTVEDDPYVMGDRPRVAEVDNSEREIIIIKAGDFLAPINDYLGVTQENIVEFTQTGDPGLLGKIDGEPILLPSFIISDVLGYQD